MLDSGCCGLAGNFGFEQGHYEVSVACGEQVLLPRLRAEQMSVAGQRWPQAARVAASGRDLGKHGPDEASLADRLPGAGLRRAASSSRLKPSHPAAASRQAPAQLESRDKSGSV